MAYTKNRRPYMIVVLSNHPKAGQQTSRKDWGKIAQWDMKESIFFEDKIKNRFLSEAGIIIDLLNAKLVKNCYRNREGGSDEEIMAYFIKRYGERTQGAIKAWMTDRGIELTPEQVELMENNTDVEGVIGKVLSGDTDGLSTNVDVTDMIKVED